MPADEAVAADIEQALINSATEGVRTVSVDGLTVSSHSLAELIEAKKFLDSQSTTSAAQPHRGLRFSRMIPPGGGG